MANQPGPANTPAAPAPTLAKNSLRPSMIRILTNHQLSVSQQRTNTRRPRASPPRIALEVARAVERPQPPLVPGRVHRVWRSWVLCGPGGGPVPLPRMVRDKIGSAVAPGPDSTPHRSSGRSIALVEPNRFHAETIFSFACVAAATEGRPAVDVFSPDHRGAMDFATNRLRVTSPWRSVDGFVAPAGGHRRGARYDLVILNTYPPMLSDDPRPMTALAVAAGRRVLGLVHDVAFLERIELVRELLERFDTLSLAHAGVRPPPPLAGLPAHLRARITRFVPVFRFASRAGPDGGRTGVALPGSIEFSRRDYDTAVRAAAGSGVLLSVFGRTSAPWHPGDVEASLLRDRQRFEALVADHGGLPAGFHAVYDPSFTEFYSLVDAARFVAVLPVNPEYLRGKLTAVITAALTCGVPLLCERVAHDHLRDAESPTIENCSLPFDAASSGVAAQWRSAVDVDAATYRALCADAVRTRERFIAENAGTLARLLL
jgi:hypothetical protein